MFLHKDSAILALMVILACVGTITAAPYNSTDQGPRILILGAGMAGITAAKTLDDNGFKNYHVIEGTSRIGGRMKSVSLSGTTVEHGPFWIYASGTNPIYLMSKEFGLSIKRDPETWKARDSSGNDVTKELNKADKRFFKAFDDSEGFTQDAINQGKSDYTVAARLRHFGWSPETIVEDALEYYYMQWDFGLSTSELSGKLVGWDVVGKQFGNEELWVVDDPRGFQALPRLFAESFMDINERVDFNKVITKVKQNENGVVVTTSDGTRYKGDYVISTFSLGVMQKRAVSFSPALPDCKLFAIDSYEIGRYSHFYLHFPSVFWDNTMYILYVSEKRTDHRVFTNINRIKRDSNILELSVEGETARYFAKLDDAAIIDEILPVLQKMYPRKTIPYPSNVTRYAWGEDPLFYGGWSEIPPGFTTYERKTSQAPFGRVYFAGEALSVQSGYVHSAYLSGETTANDLSRCLQNPDECEEFVCAKPEDDTNTGRFG